MLVPSMLSCWPCLLGPQDNKPQSLEALQWLLVGVLGEPGVALGACLFHPVHQPTQLFPEGPTSLKAHWLPTQPLSSPILEIITWFAPVFPPLTNEDDCPGEGNEWRGNLGSPLSSRSEMKMMMLREKIDVGDTYKGKMPVLGGHSSRGEAQR